jgi:hypothetical protein
MNCTFPNARLPVYDGTHGCNLLHHPYPAITVIKTVTASVPFPEDKRKMMQHPQRVPNLPPSLPQRARNVLLSLHHGHRRRCNLERPVRSRQDHPPPALALIPALRMRHPLRRQSCLHHRSKIRGLSVNGKYQPSPAMFTEVNIR